MSKTRRDVLQQLVYGAAFAFSDWRIGNDGAPVPGSVRTAQDNAPKLFNIVDYAAKGDGATDCTSAIRATFADASRSGGIVHIPPGEYAFSDTLLVGSRVTVIASDGSSLIAKSHRQAVTLTGDAIAIRGLRLRSDAKRRRVENFAHAITAVNARNVLIEECMIEGGNAAGIYLQGCQDFVVRNNRITRTLADTIHVTDGSVAGIVTGNVCSLGGDDGIAVVSYVPQGKRCRDISIVDNTISSGSARGIAVLGGERVRISGNRIHDTRWAGIYIASESSWNTYSASDISVEGNRLSAVNRKSDRGTHACITVLGRAGASPAGTGAIPNQNHSIYLIANFINGDGKGGIRVDQFARSITVVANVIADTEGWGIATSALGATLSANRVEQAALGGIVVGRECLGGNTELIGNEVHLAGERPRPGILVEPSQLRRATIRSNRIRNGSRSEHAIQVHDRVQVMRQNNEVDGEAVD